MKHEIEFRVDLHRLVDGKTEGLWTSYNEPATLTKDGKTYVAYVTNPPVGRQPETIYEETVNVD